MVAVSFSRGAAVPIVVVRRQRTGLVAPVFRMAAVDVPMFFSSMFRPQSSDDDGRCVEVEAHPNTKVSMRGPPESPAMSREATR